MCIVSTGSYTNVYTCFTTRAHSSCSLIAKRTSWKPLPVQFHATFDSIQCNPLQSNHISHVIVCNSMCNTPCISIQSHACDNTLACFKPHTVLCNSVRSPIPFHCFLNNTIIKLKQLYTGEKTKIRRTDIYFQKKPKGVG